MSTVKGEITPEHNVRKKQYTVSCNIDEEVEKVLDVQCHDCAAASDEESSLFLKEIIDKGLEECSKSQLLKHFKPDVIAENLGMYQLMLKCISSGQNTEFRPHRPDSVCLS
ncbi:hypothetical protein JTB14_029618 [Gonioctena quinquepunctata]|nr:hypothetical protein JTB14_029618 [Gonioctena quinquepunctata]